MIVDWRVYVTLLIFWAFYWVSIGFVMSKARPGKEGFRKWMNLSEAMMRWGVIAVALLFGVAALDFVWSR